MEGFIKITVGDGMSVECQLYYVNKFDKMMLLHAFMNAIKMDQNAVIEAMIVNDLAEKKVENGLMEKLSGCNDSEEKDGEEDDPNWGVGWGCKASEPQITQAKFDIDAIEKLYGKKGQQEDS